MKKVTSLLLVYVACLTSASLLAQTPSPHNAVIQSQARTATMIPQDLENYLNATSVIQYQDGYGKPIEDVHFRGSPNANDLIIKTIVYDTFGLPSKEYLPYPSSSTTGAIGNFGQVLSSSSSFYGDSNPFTEVTHYDHSPLSRPQEVYGAGEVWRDSTKSVTHFYEVAGAGIKNYQIDASDNITVNGTYPVQSLIQKRSVDEEGGEVVEIIDKKGRLLEKHIQASPTDTLITSYIYDSNDRIKAVIQPEGYSLGAISFNSSGFTNYVFFYIYNDQGNVARKHIPGGEWISLVYDKVGRIVMSQDAHQESLDKWSFFTYDVFDRIAFEGELINTDDVSTLQTAFNGISTPFETYIGGANAYTTQSFPFSFSLTDARVVHYYDTYDWIPSELTFDPSSSFNASSYYPNVKSLPTGMWARSSENPNIGFQTVMYYDDKGRVLQTFQTHHLGGSQPWTEATITNYDYSFAGEVLQDKVAYQFENQQETEVLTQNSFDHVGRLTNVSHRINTATLQELCRLSYDGIGRMVEKKILPNGTFQYQGTPEYINRPPNPGIGITDLAKKAVILMPGTAIDTTYAACIDSTAGDGTSINGLQTIDYSYHIRGMMRGINLDGSEGLTPNITQGDLFSYRLDFEWEGSFDGNIAQQLWKGDTTVLRSYTYSYDDSKRLTSALYAGLAGEDYSLPSMAYDLNGNITALQRKGVTSGSNYGDIDNLDYTYSGNILTNVTDAISGSHEVDLIPRGSGAYTYYPNGALKSDENEQIQNISYDTFLKQPSLILLTDGRSIKYFYDGSGTLFKTIYLSPTNDTLQTWDMVGGMILKGDAIFQLGTPEGRAIYASSDSSWRYEFDYKDHLGNTRVSYMALGNILTQVSSTSFDPWGVLLKGVNAPNPTENRWEMQGHEREKTLGLNRINFGNRSLNPTIGRFDRVDRFSEKYEGLSPFHYTAGNPVNFIDINGDSVIVNDVGSIVRNDETDDLVFLSTSKGLLQIGELGGVIDVTEIYKNLLAQNSEAAKNMISPFSFREKVKGKGDWDYKNQKETIFGLANDGKTMFKFGNENMESQDIGNHHFGVVAEAYGWFPSQEFILKQAGSAQIAAGTSKKEWQVYKDRINYIHNRGGVTTYKTRVMVPPYGDDPRDQDWIKKGFKYYNQNLE